MSTVETRHTPKDLLRMPDAASFELVDGQFVERNVSVLSSLVEGIIFRRLDRFCEEHDRGRVWPRTLGIQCFPDDPNKVRNPDVAFVRKERLRPGHLEEGFLSIHPDLAVEVLSQNDLAYEVDEKIEEYSQARIPLIWIINPEQRSVLIHRIDGTTTKLHENDEITGENVVEGFRCRVAEFFPPRS